MRDSSPGVSGGQAFRLELRNPAPDCPPRSFFSPGQDRKCPAEVGVEVIGSWRLQWAETLPISPLSFHWCLGGAAPTTGAPGREGVEARAEGEGGGRWRRRPRKVRSGGARGYAREAFQERVRQGGDDLKGPR